jgi:hypothetical protein
MTEVVDPRLAPPLLKGLNSLLPLWLFFPS